jgi:hypothetical protein
LFCASISISMTSFSVVSLIAMVPDSECRMPTLMAGAGKSEGQRARASGDPGNKASAGEVSGLFIPAG